MTDRLPRPDLRNLHRWPADPALLIDTTRCPACFGALGSTRCDECGLDVGVPAAAELLRLSKGMFEGELARQAFIGRMRLEQAARDAAAAARGPRSDAAPVLPAAPAPVAVAAAPPPVPRQPATHATPAAAAVPPTTPASAAVPPTAPPLPATPATPAAPGRRSGVQVLLLTLGVVLISVTAIVFLFVAYLVASLEVRSVIIAGASVLVLGAAWLLRVRRLPGTAEGVASVAVVLLLLDAWIVRANGLFGTDALNAAAYTGVAFAVVAGVLAATRAASGIRVPGFAAAGLAPVSAFLLAYSVDPETATGFWLGGLAAVVVGCLAAARPGSPERVVVLAGAFSGGGVAMIAAAWALPDTAWGASWAFLAVGAGWLAMVILLGLRAAGTVSAWAWIAAAALGASVALAPAVGAVQELDAADALWVAPAGAVLAACLTALAAQRLPARRALFAAFVAAAAVVFAASVVGGFVGLVSIGERVLSGTQMWAMAADDALASSMSEAQLGAVLVPLVVAAGSAVVLAVFGRLRQFAAIPVGALLAGGLVAGAVAPTTWLAAAALVVLAGIALAAAAATGRAAIPGLLATLATIGISSGGVAWSTAYSSAPVWPWAVAALLALLIAGRMLASRVWPRGFARGMGAAHFAVAAVLAGVVAFSIPSWSDAMGTPLAEPWDASWMWVGTVASVLLAVAVFSPRIPAIDRTCLVLPLLVWVVVGATATAVDVDDALAWLPAALGAVVALVGIRPSRSVLVRTALAAAGPLLIALASGAATGAFPDAPPVVTATAGGVLLAAGFGHAVVPRSARAARVAWSIAVGLTGILTLAAWATAGDELWLLLLLLAPVPLLVASMHGDPFAGASPSRHVSWLSLPLAVGAVWAWLAGDGVDDIEAYTVPLAVALAAAGGLVTWRRLADRQHAAGRTALFASAAAVLVLPSVASSGDSELRTLVLVSAGSVVALAASFLPEAARGVPIRLLGVATGWTALTGAALVRGSAVAAGAASGLPAEFWPVLALAAGAAIAVIWTRTASHPAPLAEAMLGASVVAASVPTVLAILWDEQPMLRAAVLFPALAVAHIAGAAATSRPITGPVFAWSTLGVLVLGGVAVLVPGVVDPFDVVTASVGIALIGAGAVRMSRTPGLGSWAALGPGLAVLLLPALVADFTDPELWRLIALGGVAAAAVVVGAVRRLQAPLLLGGAVLLVHAIAQLWPWITWLYEAVWWWLWLGIAGVILVVLAATYERQLRLARGVVRSIAELR